MGFEPTDPCGSNDFESGITWICSYFSLFFFALHRLFSSFTLVFDTSDYIVLNVARGCLGNIWATLVFWATLFGAKQENSKTYTKIEDLAIFQSKSFFLFQEDFPMKNTNPAAESGAFIRRARGYLEYRRGNFYQLVNQTPPYNILYLQCVPF